MRTKGKDGKWKPFSFKEYDRLIRKVTAVRVIFEKVARIVSGLPIQLRWDYDRGDHYQAYTDGVDIYLNKSKIHDEIEMLTTVEEVGRFLSGVKGLIYHQLSHILYSPRDHDITGIAYLAIQRTNGTGPRSLWPSYQILEDQRIEAIFVGKYRPARRYFEAAVMQWILKYNRPEAVFPYIAGRSYIRPTVRKKAGDLFEARSGTKDRNRLQEIVEEFIALTPGTRGHANKGLELVVEFDQILHRAGQAPLIGDGPMPDQYSYQPAYAGSGETGVVNKGNAVGGQEQAETLEAAKAEDAEAEAEAEQEAEDDAEGTDKGDGDGDSGKGEGESPDDPTSDDQGDPADGDADPGTGIGAPNHGAKHTFKEVVETAYEEMFNDPVLSRELKTNAKAVFDVADGTMASEGEAPSSPKPIPATGRALAAKITAELRPLKLDLEPERFIRQTAGRLAIRRALGAQPHDIDLFDAWDDSLEEEGGIEAIITLDLSGSMSGRLYEASLAMWGLKRGFDEVGVKTTVLGYADDWYVLYGRDQRAKSNEFNQFSQCGGTDPSGALKHARQVFKKSREHNKLLVSITDGGWYCGGNEDADDVVKSINAIPGTTSVLIGLNQPNQRHGPQEHLVTSYHGNHNHNLSVDVFGAMDIPPVIRQVAADILRGAGRAAR